MHLFSVAKIVVSDVALTSTISQRGHKATFGGLKHVDGLSLGDTHQIVLILGDQQVRDRCLVDPPSEHLDSLAVVCIVHTDERSLFGNGR